MTKEEAAETLLREKPFKQCSKCFGRGFAPFNGYSDSCRECIPELDTKVGSGKVWNEEWKEACLFLGLELPAAVWRAVDMDGDKVKL